MSTDSEQFLLYVHFTYCAQLPILLLYSFPIYAHLPLTSRTTSRNEVHPIHPMSFIVRYAENQELLEDLENEKESLLHAVKLLKDELRRKGLPVPVLDLGSGVHAMAEGRGKEDR